MSLSAATHALDAWFAESVGEPTAVQRAAWPVLRDGGHALLIASTGQGKSLAAWRPLVERMIDRATSRKGVRALHIAPLKALARDMTANLQPLLHAAAQVQGRPLAIALRCGDTSPGERQKQGRCPPDILSTTPESLFVLLGSRGGRRLLQTVEAVVVDEIHAIAVAKRGAHLALSLARLDRLTGRPVQRIGLSATARPAETLGRYLTGGADCAVIAPDGPGAVQLHLELPEMPLGPYPNTVHWRQIHERVGDLSSRSRSMLVFCQTRAQVERTALALDELLTAAGRRHQVGAHHGSLDTTHREGIEARFKAGELSVLVSSASLELGLDLGRVERVCQIGVPGSINLVRQRAGRSGHRPGQRPCMHLFPLTLNQLIEARALADAIEAQLIDPVEPLPGPLDVLAQHLVAMVAEGMSRPEELLAVARSAWPWRNLDIHAVVSLLDCLSGVPEWMPAGQARALVIAEEHGVYRADPEAQRVVLLNAGTIPEFFEYEVVRVDTGQLVGRLDEEFAFESSPGQVIQLGRRAWRIVRVLTGQVRVEPADPDQPAELPFWFGEGAGRTPAVALAMLRLMAGQGGRLHPQARAMLDESRALLGGLPSATRLVIEQITDTGGDRHVVLHSFAGARINRAWGLALRKRFCRQFNFELQAAATDDGILISLGVTSQFDLADVAGFVRSPGAADILTQALLDTPLFLTRFRWCANNALMLLKNDLGGRIPAQRQRSQAENLVACVFPDQLACVENLTGPREVPDHPLVKQALADCLHDYMDLDGLTRLLERIECGAMEVHAVDTPRPSPLAEALIHAPRHSYLDEAAAEERRTRNFEQPHRRRFADPGIGRPGSRSRRPEPPARKSGGETGQCHSRLTGICPTTDALEDLLQSAGFLTRREGEAGLGLSRPRPVGGWTRWFSRLLREGRAIALESAGALPALWIAAERLDWFLVLDPHLKPRPHHPMISQARVPGGPEAIRAWLVQARSLIEGSQAAGTVSGLFPLHGQSERERIPLK